MNLSRLNESQKINYIREFWYGFETLLEKKRFSKRNNRTQYTSKNSVSTVSKYGIKKEYLFKNKNKEISFTIEARPWLWEDGTVWVEIIFKDAKNLVVPKSKIKKKSQGAIYKPNYDPIYFLTNTDTLVSYIQLLELTPLDVSLFDSVTAALENLIK